MVRRLAVGGQVSIHPWCYSLSRSRARRVGTPYGTEDVRDHAGELHPGGNPVFGLVGQTGLWARQE